MLNRSVFPDRLKKKFFFFTPRTRIGRQPRARHKENRGETHNSRAYNASEHASRPPPSGKGHPTPRPRAAVRVPEGPRGTARPRGQPLSPGLSPGGRSPGPPASSPPSSAAVSGREKQGSGRRGGGGRGGGGRFPRAPAPEGPGGVRESVPSPRPTGPRLTLQQSGNKTVHVQLPVRHLVGTRRSFPAAGTRASRRRSLRRPLGVPSPTSHAAFRPQLQLSLPLPPTPSPPSSGARNTRRHPQ